MKIDRKTWDEYITRLSRINKRAANEMQAFLEKLATEGGNRREEQIIERAFGLATKYGEASGAAACDFYDKIAAGTGHNVPPANPADTATFAETVKAIRGTIKNQSEAQVPSTVGRLVKQCSADTMLQNAARDGAQFAWIPSGDTCAFCLTLASRGWQFISKKAVRNGHAEHIHANCNCEYCVRFSEFETVEGYDPEKYRKMYDDAEGSTPQEKINAMRRDLYVKKEKLQSGIKGDTVNTQDFVSVSAKEAGDLVQPKEVYRDYSEFKPLELSDEVRNDLKALNKLAKETDHEYGFAVFENGRSDHFLTNNNHNYVTIAIPKDAKHVELYHCHTDDSVLSRGDFQSVLDLRVEKDTTISLNGDVWQVDYTAGVRPTEKQLERAINGCISDARNALESYSSFSKWSELEREYMLGREIMYRIAHFFEWSLAGGHIDG